jgi:hypothetical protein
MNPPNVYEVTIPSIQRIRSRTAIVQSIDKNPFPADSEGLTAGTAHDSVAARLAAKYPVNPLVAR